jgi:thiosulfate dehydrogenase
MRAERAIAGGLLAIAAYALAPLPRVRAQQPSSAPHAIDWHVPDAEALPAGPWKDTVLYGRRVFVETSSLIGPDVTEPAMRLAGNNLSCQSCHLVGGTQAFALPMIGVFAAFPMYMARENEVRTIEDRIDGCMERSMNGRVLPSGGREMKALVSYLQFLSGGVPVGGQTPGRGTPTLPFLDRAADVTRGRTVFAATCQVCHQADGQGLRKDLRRAAAGYVYPPLWGPDSFNDGAGMDHFERAVGFIQHNMPRGIDPEKPKLTLQEAWDVAAFLRSRPRPHYEAR